jgi:hypothetical protein
MRKITFALVAVLLLTSGYVLAQVTTANLPSTAPTTSKVTVVVPKGSDPAAAAQALQIKPAEPLPISDQLALRIEGEHDGRVYGTLVVKVDGRWVDVQLASKAIRAH